MAKNIKNQYNVKINDVFCLDNNHYIRFFQVVALKGKTQVVIREIESEKIGENEYKEDIVIPHINHFKSESVYMEDNNLGLTKILKKEVDSDNEEYIYISFNWFINRKSINGTRKEIITYLHRAYLWDGKPKLHDLVYY